MPRIPFALVLVVSVPVLARGEDDAVAKAEKLLRGDGGPRDAKEAYRLVKEAAEKGSAPAMYLLGEFLEYGYEATPTNQTEAVTWYRNAATAGLPTAQAKLGIQYHIGVGIEASPAEATRWVEKALPELRKRADGGDVAAQACLGVCYEFGLGVKKDEPAAVALYRKAAEAGDRRAMTNLGQCYSRGTGIAADPATAIRWLRKAADAGNARAMYGLGQLLADEKIKEFDKAAAIEWYRKAARQGHVGAKEALVGLGEKP